MRSGSASSEARKARRSDDVSRSWSSAARSVSPAAASSGASRSSGATARSADPTRSAAPSSVLGRERRDRGGRPGSELGHVTEPLAIGAQLVLDAGLEPVRVGDERAQLVEPCRRGRRVARQLVVQPPRRRQLAPGAPRLAHRPGRPGERVEHRELVARACEPPLLELAAHREQALDRGRDVLARGGYGPRRRRACGRRRRSAVRATSASSPSGCSSASAPSASGSGRSNSAST